MAQALDCAMSVEGSGPPLILVHGIGAARNTWAKLMPVLTPHFTVVSYDLRGHGASPMPDGEFGLDELVADLERVRERSGFDQVHVAGHSLGGMIGPAYARLYPERVLSLGVLSTAAFRTEEDSTKVLGVVRAMEERGIPNILPTLTDRWFTDAFIAEHGDVVERRLKQVIGTDAGVFLNVFRIYATVEMSPWLHEVATPALVLTGENDGGCPPRLNEKIAAAMPNAELVILPEYKHSLLLEAGEIVAEHIKRFIHGL
ncbi:alpha/beta fold hydrolase [Roseovarius faecimaris]|uniref:Alpha/beta fold hydrolase n=1 Tax=Roseovarius faecimaris TaxID=2494550 RepID=A0A6I6IM76_9RHOB|nr:alpha/beta hydrolase [Roseovarius faecimaris]QGX97402.1 alpha/beta fold hydrolase [Roseovarius faecimaris]